ncbi:MAG: hypothetical protein WA748_14315 [Candidatus Acidiferrum sp.]
MERRKDGAFGTGLALGHVTPKRVLHSNLGCCIGTRRKSATYEISGAPQRRKFLYANLLKTKAAGRRVDFEGFLLRCAFRSERQEARMVKPVFRRKSIGTKVSEEEYARLEALAGGRALGEWVREVLLRELEGRQARPADETLLAEVLALRTILLNLHFAVAKGEAITAEAMQAIIDRADAGERPMGVGKPKQ